LQEKADFFLFPIQPRFSQHTLRAAKQSALGAGGCQSFACALGDQVSLDLGEQADCKSCFLSKWMLSLMAVKRILRFTSSSTM
jgi:hypothetical protein